VRQQWPSGDDADRDVAAEAAEAVVAVSRRLPMRTAINVSSIVRRDMRPLQVYSVCNLSEDE